MCGIAGYINHSGRPADQKIIGRMLVKLQHRGPDHQKTWAHQNIALGYTRLKILDLSDNGNQPFITQDQNGILFYNGEVYNFRELQNELKKEGATFKSRCDTEVVLAALHTWGPERAVSRFNGMFAFAYYNKRTKTLWLGRDRTGIKPLYLVNYNDITAFASEMKALFGHPEIPCRPDLHALTSFFLDQRLNRISPFENIREVRPGTLIMLKDNEEEEFVYFDLLRDLDVDRISEGNKTDYNSWLDQFEKLFPKCVESHLKSDAPLAFMTSGGVDSSLLTAISRDHKPELQAYVADPKGDKTNEVSRAKRACNHIGVNLKHVQIHHDDYMRLWPKAAYYHEEPFYFRQTILHMAIAGVVAKDGFKVLLCGEGADEIFGGYSLQANTYKMWELREKRLPYLKFLAPFRRIIKKISNAQPLFSFDEFKEDPFYNHKSPHEYIHKRAVTSVGGKSIMLRRRAIFNKLSTRLSFKESAFITRCIEDFEEHLATLLKINDKMNMAFSVESRVPFLDNRLIDFAFHLPVSTKYKQGVSKYILKHSASKRLPKDLMYQKKIGFFVPDRMNDYSISLLDGGWVEEWLKWRRDEKDEIKHLFQQDSLFKFHLMSTEIWARIYFGNEDSETLTEKLLASL